MTYDKLIDRECKMGVNDESSIFSLHCKNEFDRINKTLERIDQSLNGNGKPGLLTRLDRAEGQIVQCSERHQQENNRRWDIAKPLIISVVAAVLSTTGIIKLSVFPISKADIAKIIQQVLADKE